MNTLLRRNIRDEFGRCFSNDQSKKRLSSPLKVAHSFLIDKERPGELMCGQWNIGATGTVYRCSIQPAA